MKKLLTPQLKIEIFILFVLLSVLIFSCSGKNTNHLEELTETSTVNEGFQIIEIPGQKDIKKNNELISFQIINLSDENIVFPSDYAVKLLVFRNDKWEQINNCFHYAEVERLLPEEEGPQIGLVFSVFPCMEEINENMPLRVWVSGNKENETREQVTGYIEIQLGP